METKFKLEMPKFTKREVAAMVVKGVVQATIITVVVTCAVIGAVVVLAVAEGAIKSKLDPEGWAAEVKREEEAEN